MVTEDFVVSGTCSEQMYGMCESLWEPDLVGILPFFIFTLLKKKNYFRWFMNLDEPGSGQKCPVYQRLLGLKKGFLLDQSQYKQPRLASPNSFQIFDWEAFNLFHIGMKNQKVMKENENWTKWGAKDSPEQRRMSVSEEEEDVSQWGGRGRQPVRRRRTPQLFFHVQI